MAYNTGNPLGSKDPKDLYDNATNFDRYANGPDPFYPNRFGEQKLSIEGMNEAFNSAQDGRTAEFQEFLADSAFVRIGDYGAGLTFTNYSQYMVRDGVPYRLQPATTIPYTTTGNWALEGANFTPINPDDILRQDLAADNGSTRVAFKADGADTVKTDVQARLRKIAVRSDYTTDAAFNAAKVDKPSIDASGNLGGSVLPTGGGVAVPLADIAKAAKDPTILRQFMFAPRPIVRYRTASAVRIHAFNANMGEFRFMSQFTKGVGRVLPLPSQLASVVGTGLGAESTFRSENWYAAFAVANAGDSNAAIKTMPYLRVGSVAGKKVTLNKAGEAIHTVQAQTYAWLAANNLAGCKCLVVSEGGNLGTYSGRVTTVTANAAGTVDLDDVTGLAFGDFLLPAPPGFTEFGYLGSFYMDTAEVRNIYDDGHKVRSRGIYILSPVTNGKITDWTALNANGYISPLATAVLVQSSFNISTSSTGRMVENFAADSGNHTLFPCISIKASAPSMPVSNYGIEIPFLYPGTFYYSNAGDDAMLVNRIDSQQNIAGYVES